MKKKLTTKLPAIALSVQTLRVLADATLPLIAGGQMRRGGSGGETMCTQC